MKLYLEKISRIKTEINHLYQIKFYSEKRKKTNITILLNIILSLKREGIELFFKITLSPKK